MKTIGLLGGMSWESTEMYYRIINEYVKTKLGGLHSAKICLYSINFQEIEKSLRLNDWKAITKNLSNIAKNIELCGADFLLICTNTMHKVASEIENNINIPVLHIVDATAEKVIKQGIDTIGLIGTKPTMEAEFYKGRLTDKFNLKVVVPDANDRQIAHDVIFNELCLGKIKESSRKQYLRIIEQLSEQGAKGVILGCTELALLVQKKHTAVLLFDTTRIHAEKAAEMALS